MKRILLLSDTHSHIDERILHHAKASDEVWHAGDIGQPVVTEKLGQVAPLRAVWGNIDDDKARRTWKEWEVYSAEGVKVLLIHIAGKAGSYTPVVRELIELHQPQILVCGHSHILKVMRDEKNRLLYLNPGAAGRLGFHKMRTMLRFQIVHGKLEHMEVIELGKRSALPESINGSD